MIRFGIIGTNWITERFLDAAKDIEDFTLTAVYSRTEEKAKTFAGKYNATQTFTNIEEMVKSDVIDAVYIASPNSLHAEQAILSMNHGKHVICEKPLASNKKEVESMMQAAQKNKPCTKSDLFAAILRHFVNIPPVMIHINKGQF